MNKDSKLLLKPLGYLYFILLGSVFVFVCKISKDIYENGNIEWTYVYFMGKLIPAVIIGALIGGITSLVLYRIYKNKEQKASRPFFKWISIILNKIAKLFFVFNKGFNGKLSYRIMHASSLILILMAWYIPFLAYYPGILAYDSPVQFGMIFDGYMIDHHPIAHTLVLRLFTNAGIKYFGSANTGVAIYTLVQMIILALAFSYAIGMMRRMNVAPAVIVISLLFAMFYPFNWYMAVSMTKDTFFTAFFLIAVTNLIYILYEDDNKYALKSTDAGYGIFLYLGMLFRNNFIYAFAGYLIVLAVIFLTNKKRAILWRRIALISLVVFIAGGITLSILFRMTNAEQGDRRESLSMPIQQFARTMLYHGGVGIYPEDDGTMREKDKALINDFLLDGAYGRYDADFADPVKSHTNTYVARYRTADFIKSYTGLFEEYTGDFVNAFLALDAGYLYPNDITHAHIFDFEGIHNKGYVQTYWLESELSARGLYKNTKWQKMYITLEEWADNNTYLGYGIFKYLFVPGVFIWAYLFLAGVILIRRDYGKLAIIALILLYMMTLLLGPVVSLRYVYPLMGTFPIIAAITLKKKNKGRISERA
ncbi:MAG: hypothetical protein IJ608_10175 [Lachnospiraceae bacterium]|nr:hypothetical protein [Lachnospiraceae bacterium]